MHNWSGSNDQYIVDTESRYPDFSDATVDEQSFYAPRRPTNRKNQQRTHDARTYESKFQYEQQGIPTYLPCKCGTCPMSYLFPRGNPPMRTQTVDERWRDMQLARDAMYKQPVAKLEVSAPRQPDQSLILLFFFFIVFVFICCFCVKAIGDLSSQMHSIKQLVKNN